MDGKANSHTIFTALSCDGWLGEFLYTKPSSQTEKRKPGHSWYLGSRTWNLANMYKIWSKKTRDMTVTAAAWQESPSYMKLRWDRAFIQKAFRTRPKVLPGKPSWSRSTHRWPEMGSRNKTTLAMLPNPWAYQEYLCRSALPVPALKSMASRPSDLWKDNSRRDLRWV